MNAVSEGEMRMFSYHKRLLYPVKVEYPDREFACLLLEHFSGENSEYNSFIRNMYLSLHIVNPYLRDFMGMIAAEELGHWEIIAAAVKKLGFAELPFERIQQIQFATEKDKSDNEKLLSILRENIKAEKRTKQLYLKHLEMTKDTYLKRMLNFLADREDIHERLLKRIEELFSQNATNEQFTKLIHEYRMSLRVVG